MPFCFVVGLSVVTCHCRTVKQWKVKCWSSMRSSDSIVVTASWKCLRSAVLLWVMLQLLLQSRLLKTATRNTRTPFLWKPQSWTKNSFVIPACNTLTVRHFRLMLCETCRWCVWNYDAFDWHVDLSSFSCSIRIRYKSNCTHLLVVFALWLVRVDWSFAMGAHVNPCSG